MNASKKLGALICLSAVFIFAQNKSDPIPATADSSIIKTDSTATAKKSETTPVQVKKASPVVEESEEELILDGGEESLIPVEVEKSQTALPVSADAANNAVTANDSGKSSVNNISDTLNNDTASAVTTEKHLESVVSPITLPKPEELPPPVIEKPQLINFAKNYKEYRSPKIAIILSLLVPGAGQAYAQNYLKTGIFGAVEAALITAGAIFRVQGNNKWDNARSYADEHYSLDKFKEYYTNLSSNFSDTVIKQIFEPDSFPPATFLKSAKNKNDDYYDYIGTDVSPYVQGWDDTKPHFNSSFDMDSSIFADGKYVQDEDSAYLVYFINNNGDSTESQYGFSNHQSEYNDQLSDANSKYRTSKYIFTALLINHIASAIDAGITAKAHNDRLLGKTSFWQDINIREKTVSTPTGMASGLSLEVRF